MFDSIYVGTTGLLGFSRGLRVISNNTTNMNTTGFKSSSVQFADLFYSDTNFAGSASGQGKGQIGYGLNTTGTSLSFKQGELRQTANALDLAIDGLGLFLLKDDAGHITYTRAGQFEFNDDGVLINKGSTQKVMGLDANGSLVDISIAGLKTNPAKATTTVTFNGNLSSTATTQTVGGVKVIDAVGGEHLLDVKLTNQNTTTPGAWQVDLMDGTTVVGSGQIVFINGVPDPSNAKVSVTYTPSGQSPIPLTLDFSTDVTSFASGNLSTLAMNKQDGFGPGSLTAVTFDSAGTLVLTYSNGQTDKGARLALAQFDSPDSIAAVGNNQFVATDQQGWKIGVAGSGGFGTVSASMLETSNVDLSKEFSDLVIMQRGYQASSQVISTANEMLQELFAMKTK
jgi:flagellar hook protein FlgE